MIEDFLAFYLALLASELTMIFIFGGKDGEDEV